MSSDLPIKYQLEDALEELEKIKDVLEEKERELLLLHQRVGKLTTQNKKYARDLDDLESARLSLKKTIYENKIYYKDGMDEKALTDKENEELKTKVDMLDEANQQGISLSQLCANMRRDTLNLTQENNHLKQEIDLILRSSPKLWKTAQRFAERIAEDNYLERSRPLVERLKSLENENKELRKGLQVNSDEL